MPTYEYVCKSCGHLFEIVQSMRDDPLTECPECGGELRKVFAPPAISFKGSGFYATDHGKRADKGDDKGDKGTTGDKADKGEKGSKKSESGSGDAKKDSKSEAPVSAKKESSSSGTSPSKEGSSS